MVIAPFFSFEMILGDVEPRVAYVANKVRVFGLGVDAEGGVGEKLAALRANAGENQRTIKFIQNIHGQ